MKNLVVLLCLLFAGNSLLAQPSGGGGRRGMGGGQRQGPPSGMGQMGIQDRNSLELRLDSFPEIPLITLEQRADIGIILATEQKYVIKLFEQKRELMDKEHQLPNVSEKDKGKTQRSIAEIDSKIHKRQEKSNNKIQKLLSSEQYVAFLEKRKDFKFSRVPPAGFLPPKDSDLREGGFGGRSPGGGMNQRFGR